MNQPNPPATTSNPDREKIIVAGTGLGDQAALEQLRPLTEHADSLAGGKRLLDNFRDFRGEKIPIGANAAETVEKLVAAAENGENVLILASGDPLFLGVGALVAKTAPPGLAKFIPNVTALQAFMNALGIPWEKAEVFSSHGRQGPLPWRRVLLSPLPVIYGDPAHSPAELAAALIAKYPPCANREAAAAENLGSENERIVRGALAEIAETDLGGLSMLALPPRDPDSPVGDPGLPLGLPEDDFERSGNIITNSETRAVAVSKLKPGPGVVWDLGAGSGSVGIEIALLVPGATVHAVEKNPERVEMIKHNAESAGANNLKVLEADALTAMDSLPAPRAVFVGGGGDAVVEIVSRAFDRLLPGGRIVVPAITLETKSAISAMDTPKPVEVVSISVARDREIGGKRYLKPLNPVELHVFEKLAEEMA